MATLGATASTATFPATAADVGADASGAAATAASGAASALATHDADTTSVHGITNTANLYVAGGTDVALADGGTGASTAATARTNLGLSDIPWTLVTKASDESVSSSTTPQNDDELFFATVASACYEWEIILIYAGAGATPWTQDLKVMPGESGTYWGPTIGLGISTSDTLNVGGLLSNASQTQTYGTAAGNRMMQMSGIYVAGGGNFNFAWSQNTSDANATIVRAGSILRYRRVL